MLLNMPFRGHTGERGEKESSPVPSTICMQVPYVYQRVGLPLPKDVAQGLLLLFAARKPT